MLITTPARSFYDSNTLPMIKMMSLMMELMSLMIGGGTWGKHKYPPLAASTVMPLNGFGGNGLPLSSVYGNIPVWNNMNDIFSQQNFLRQNNLPGLNTTSLNGIWQSMSGDIMVVYYENKFIWTDGKNRHLVGTLAINNQQLMVYITNKQQVLQFKFYRQNNKFVVQDASGNMYVFTRIY